MAARRELEHLEGLFEESPIGFGILDRELRFVRVNRALAALDGIGLEAHRGRTPDALLPDFGPELTATLRRAVTTGEVVSAVPVAGVTSASPGVPRLWLVSAYPVGRKRSGGPSEDVAVVDAVALAVVQQGPRDPGPSAADMAEALGVAGFTAQAGLAAGARSQLLNDFYVAAVRRHTDEREILELLARRAAETVGDAAFVSLVRDGRLEAVASHARDREQRRLAERLLPLFQALDDLAPDRPPRSDRTVSLSAGSPDDQTVLFDAGTRVTRAFLEQAGAHATLSVPLHVEGRVVGALDLLRVDPAQPDYSSDDVALVEGLVLRASLVLENARAILERESMRRRAEVTAEFLEAVAENGEDDDDVLRLLAGHAARAIGDAAIVVTRDAEGGWLEMVALESTDRDLDGAVRRRLEGRRIAVEIGDDADDEEADGERDGHQDELGPAGYEPAGFETEKPETDRFETAAFEPTSSEPAGLDAVAPPEGVALREIVDAIGPSAVIAQPLHAGGRLAGALVMLRAEGMRPYDADEVDLIRNLAGRASLALDNVRTHSALHATAARLATIFEESPLPTVELDESLRVTRWNRAAEELFGWTEAELRGRPLPIVPPERSQEIAEIARRTLGGEVIRGLETVRVKRDGTPVQVATYDAAIRGPDGRPTGVILRLVDIDQRKRLEAELQRTSETLRAILDASPIAITAMDLDLKVAYWNKASERLFGWTTDEACGSAPPYLVEGEPDPVGPLLDRVRAGETVVLDDVRRVARSGDVVTVRVFVAPIRNETGEVVGILALNEDLRAQRQLEAELFEARKMESVGRLAGGIAHDFNNILTAIIGFSDLALSEHMSSSVEQSLTTIKASAERAAGLTQQLLAFSRRQMLQPQVVDPNEVVLRMEAILRQLIGEQIDLAISVTPAVGSIRVDRTQLEQVILNLALNARDAMPDGGRLAIRTEHVRFDETSLSRHFEMTPGDYVQISVNDTGIGMDEATKAHIFEPFFTTKDAGAGTGLGLATTYGIVKQSGGYIWVYSEPGKGSSFKLHFPALPDEVTEPRPIDIVAGRRSGRILLVEDEPLLRELGRQVLTRQGYEVVVAANGIEAVRIVEAERTRGRQPFDLLMTDVVMPRVSGTDLARRMRARQPDLRVLLMSGYAEEIAGGGTRDAAFLAKPFTPDTLLRTVDEVMRDRRRAGRPGT